MKTKELIHEIKHHTPFTALATLIAILIILALQYLVKQPLSETLFGVFHPIHVLASAMVSAGIFYKYKPKFIQALLVGITGAIILGSLSDIILPWLGGNLLTLKTAFHLPLIETPIIIILSALIGSSIGILTKITKMPHFIHVGLSVFASLFYILAFSQALSLMYFIGAFFVVLIAVIIPCCISDILYPFFFLGKKIKTCSCK